MSARAGKGAWRTGFLLLLAAVCSSCALRRPAAGPLAQEAVPALRMARTGDAVTLTWDSVAGREYTVLYTDDLLAPDWKPLPQRVNLRGTGGRMEVRDEPSPERGMRYYRLHVGHYP